MNEPEVSARPATADLPETIAPGSVILVVGSVAPAADSFCLEVVHRYAAPEDVAVVVATTTGVDETAAEYSVVVGDEPAAALAVVDTVSRNQNVAALHRAVPTVFTSRPADLARVTVAVDTLETKCSSGGGTHIVVRSVAPFFEDDAAAVVRGMGRTFGDRPDDGLVVLGVDFTAVDAAAMAALEDLADAVVRVTVSESGDRRLEHRGPSLR